MSFADQVVQRDVSARRRAAAAPGPSGGSRRGRSVPAQAPAPARWAAASGPSRAPPRRGGATPRRLCSAWVRPASPPPGHAARAKVRRTAASGVRVPTLAGAPSGDRVTPNARRTKNVHPGCGEGSE
jgi:hypothetical protein